MFSAYAHLLKQILILPYLRRVIVIQDIPAVSAIEEPPLRKKKVGQPFFVCARRRIRLLPKIPTAQWPMILAMIPAMIGCLVSDVANEEARPALAS